jgi:predicted Holliday junction resolvase-like endonuclease
MNELVQQFQDFRTILCVCPCCGDIVRISDLKLRTTGKTSRTWRDKYDRDVQKMETMEEKFGEIEEELRALARERGRLAAQKVFNNAISPELKKMKYNPFDVKPVFYPIDFLVFNGMNEKESVDELILLSRQSKSPILNSIRDKIDLAVTQENYGWQEARIDDVGKILFK